MITGIKVDLETASDWWSPTADALFLGIYSENGGREFRLNGDVQLNSPNQDISLVLGDGCCRDDTEIQVQYSQNMQVNDPRLNPIVLSDVKFVYLRKETADSTSVNDDQFKLDRATILLCSTDGRLRRFRKTRNINFSDEGGLQHWLGEISPPKCRVTVRLKTLYHNDEAKNPAGYNWEFDFGARVNGSTSYILNDHPIKIKRRKEPDEWHRHFDQAVSFDVIGCCGQTIPIEVFGSAVEFDWPDADDKGSGHTHHTVTCSDQATTIDGTVEFIVDAKFKNRKSKIKFEYCVTSVCIP